MPAYALEGRAPSLPAPGAWWMAPDAQLIGDVHVAEDVGIWFGAVLRGDNEPIRIGPRSNVQEHAVIHADPGFPATIGAEVTIGHRAIVHGATVGDGVLIGMGAIVLNGAKIGAGCLIGAGALIPEGREVPPGSLVVDAPGKAVRTLDAAAQAGLRESARGYVENWKRFAAGLRAL